MRSPYTYLLFLSIIFTFYSCNDEISLKEKPYLNKVHINKPFRIVLPENHQTGYIWFLVEDYDKKMVEHTNTVWHGNEKGVYFSFRALKTGNCELNFVSRKYTDTADFNHFSLNITSP